MHSYLQSGLLRSSKLVYLTAKIPLVLPEFCEKFYEVSLKFLKQREVGKNAEN